MINTTTIRLEALIAHCTLYERATGNTVESVTVAYYPVFYDHLFVRPYFSFLIGGHVQLTATNKHKHQKASEMDLTFEADGQPFSLRVPNHRLYRTTHPVKIVNALLNHGLYGTTHPSKPVHTFPMPWVSVHFSRSIYCTIRHL